MNGQNSIALFVLWQSLVVDAYRSFFYFLGKFPTITLGLAAPRIFRELGGQLVVCAPFPKDPKVQTFVLRGMSIHTQVVLFYGLIGSLRNFFLGKKANRVFLCIAEPYSITAFAAWWMARLALGKDFHFICYALQNIYKQMPFSLRVLQKFVFKHSRMILVAGSEHEAVLRRHGYRGPCMDFPLWYNSNLFRHMDRGQAIARLAQYSPEFKIYSSQTPPPLLLGFSGSLVHEKGIFDLLQCFAENLGEWKERCGLLIAGGGREMEKVKSAAADLRKQGAYVCCLGPLPAAEMPAFFNFIDNLVVPSKTAPHWKEQFGRVIIEAQACGSVVIGSDSGEIPKVIGAAERIFREGHIEDMARVIKMTLALFAKQGSPMEMRQTMRTRAEKYADFNLAEKFADKLQALASSFPSSG